MADQAGDASTTTPLLSLTQGAGGGVDGGVGSEGGEPEGRECDGRWVAGGRVRFGAALSPELREWVEERRRSPAEFASWRNLRGVKSEELWREELPRGLLEWERGREGRRKKRKKRRPLDRPSREEACPHADAQRVRPEGPIHISQLYCEGVYATKVEGWFRWADEACADMQRRARGEEVDMPRVPTVVIEQSEQPQWARGIIWDCADPHNCVPVTRSDRHTSFPGKRQVDRAAVRRIADELGWGEVDADIIAQVGEGGVEARSGCDMITVLAFHHPGLLADVGVAAAAVDKQLKEGWVSAPVRHLPFVPCRLQPRDIILQDRVRVRRGEFHSDGRPVVESYLKPRITTNCSYGGEDGVNAGVDEADSVVDLPRVQWLARALAICDTAFTSRESGTEAARAGAYCVDAESAYSFCVVQQADHWLQCFVWWGLDGLAGVCVDRRLGFGGAFAPNRFQRFSTFVAAWVARKQADFDRSQPPMGLQAWQRGRQTAREAARTSPLAEPRQQQNATTTSGGSAAQKRVDVQPRYVQVYIDDVTGCAGEDIVIPPAELADMTLDPLPTTAVGGVFTARDTRLYVHAQLAVKGMADVGLCAAPDKVQAGDGVVALGFQLWRSRGPTTPSDAGELKLPTAKRASMLQAVHEAAETLKARGEVVQKSTARLVGRLSNEAQVLPELKTDLRAGYALSSVRWKIRGKGWHTPATLKPSVGGARAQEFAGLLGMAAEVLTVNAGVPLAPDPLFPSDRDEGVSLAATDASGDDGFGGFAFFADTPGHVWLVSEPWPEDVLEARREADTKRADRHPGRRAELAMPSAELFAAWAVPAAAVAAKGGHPEWRAAISLGDCAPAAKALDAAASGSPQMRALLKEARRGPEQWLGVHIPREANRDADILSHPSRRHEVWARAEAAGLTPHWARTPSDCWRALRQAMWLPTASSQLTWSAELGI